MVKWKASEDSQRQGGKVPQGAGWEDKRPAVCERKKKGEEREALTLGTLDTGRLLANLVDHSSSAFCDALGGEELGWSRDGDGDPR